jgi:hypothetical protein
VVVSSLKDAKSVEDFIIEWRKHFMAKVDPHHIRPAGGWIIPLSVGEKWVLVRTKTAE